MLIRQFGSSEYAKTILNQLWGTPPKIDFADELALYECLSALAKEGVLNSARDSSDGGLAVAVAEACLSREIGALLELVPYEPESFVPNSCRLFEETTSNVIVSCTQDKIERVTQIAEDFGFVTVLMLGHTGGNRLKIQIDQESLIEVSLEDLKQEYSATLPSLLTEVHA